jgi:Fe-S-cluster-containing hydrogenase component 2
MRTYLTGVAAAHLGGCRIRYTCPLGHETVRDYARGPAAERLSEAAAHRLAIMWGDRIRIPFTCRKCKPRHRRRSAA